jgi:hypothetical protein
VIAVKPERAVEQFAESKRPEFDGVHAFLRRKAAGI